MDQDQLRYVLEAALLAAGRPLSIDQLKALFGEQDGPSKQDLRAALEGLAHDYADRGIALNEVASGFRIEVRPAMSPWLAKLWEERPPRYSRALMETLAIIAYRQPVTRGDVEEIRGVVVTTNILRTLLERGWVKVVGYRDVPGKPAMYGTTREFLDYFGLRQLDDLPALEDVKDLDRFTLQLELADGEAATADTPPGTATPLLRPLDPDLPTEPATVTSIDEARATLHRASHADEAVEPAGEYPAGDNVIPLKLS